MHIAIDARELAGQRTGVGRYIDRLLANWGELPAAASHRFTLYAHAPIAGDWRVNWTPALLPGTGGCRWEQITLAAALRHSDADVLLAPAYTAPILCGLPFVLTIHDVSFLAHPEWFRWRERWRRRVLTVASARRARTVLTVSEFSRREIETRIGLPASRLRVVPHGVDRPPVPGAGTADAPKEPPRVLFVGSLLNRRHVLELVRAVAIAAQSIADLQLVVAGDNRTWPYEDPAALASELGMASRIHLRAFVDDEELGQLYRSASVFVFLSEYEGFGLTPLEALAAGVPPIVLDTPVAREVYGRAARYVERPDPKLVAGAIVEMIGSAAARAEVLAAAASTLAHYRWADAAATTLAVLEEGANPGRTSR